MRREVEFSDPLLRAIDEFRDELVLWIDTELDRLHERDNADKESLVVETKMPAVAIPQPRPDAEPQTSVSNPRQRLDALARLLDHRLKQAHGAGETTGATGKGMNTGVDDETP